MIFLKGVCPSGAECDRILDCPQLDGGLCNCAYLVKHPEDDVAAQDRVVAWIVETNQLESLTQTSIWYDSTP